MNLIEQLGGYQAAKEFLNETLNNKYPNEILSRELLKYRRQHNIFEIGDYYVYLYEWDSDLDIVCKFNPSEWNDHLWNIRNMIRHATNEEIKAGRRL